MKIFEVVQQLKEGGKTGPVRYNSEVGLLYGLIGNGQFDPKNPESSIPKDRLANPTQTYTDIKKLLVPNFDEKIFNQWAGIATAILPKITAKQGELPTKLGWAGGANQAGGVADISFAQSTVLGISIKAEGGITLANLTPKKLGIQTAKGVDVFAFHAEAEFNTMKAAIFRDVIIDAKANPDKELTPIDRYSITYNNKTKEFDIVYKKGSQLVKGSLSEEKILSSTGKNAPWQRVFGDWFQANWQSKKSYAAPLYQKIAKVFETTIENHLRESAQLTQMLRFSEEPYYYATPNNLYYVPSIDQVTDLTIKRLRYAEPDGTSQRFIAEIGRPDSKENAELDIYVRYANGMFACNPTVRIQSLKNPQFISWELL